MADVVPISGQLRAAREAVLAAHLAAHNAGDVEGVLATYRHPRVELIASGRVLDGPDEVRAYLVEQRRSFPDATFEPIHLHHCDGAVVAEHWLSGTHLGELQGMAATGRRFRVRMATVFDFDGDALVNQRTYYDRGTIARQLA